MFVDQFMMLLSMNNLLWIFRCAVGVLLTMDGKRGEIKSKTSQLCVCVPSAWF